MKDRLNGWTYKQLVWFGPPTFPNPNGDNKSKKNGCLKELKTVTFTLYDWKKGDPNVTMNFNTTWNIGSKVAGEFVTELITQLKKKNRLTKHIEEWIKDKSYEDLVNELVDMKVNGENTQKINFGFKRFNNDYLKYRVTKQINKIFVLSVKEIRGTLID